MGLCSYYRRHILGSTELAAPLYGLVTKGTDFEFPWEHVQWYFDANVSDIGRDENTEMCYSATPASDAVESIKTCHHRGPHRDLKLCL